MKKIFMIVGICFLFLGMSIVSSMPLKELNNSKTNNILSGLESDGAPNWADGTFNGTWGIREYSIFFHRLLNIELGTVSGYYTEGNLGYFVGEFIPHWNTSMKTEINGLFFGQILFGQIGDLTVDDVDYEGTVNETIYVGIGSVNETDFNWRLMGLEGPTFYMKGNFEKFL